MKNFQTGCEHRRALETVYIQRAKRDQWIIVIHTASIAQLAEHALRKRMVLGSIPSGGFLCEAYEGGRLL